MKVRLAKPADYDQIHRLNSQVCQKNSERDMLEMLVGKHALTYVAESQGLVVGFVSSRLDRPIIHLNKIVVANECRRIGIGSMLMSEITGKIGTRWTMAAYLVRDDCLDLQLFLKSCGFVATEVVRDVYDMNVDGYFFEFRRFD